MEGIEHRIVSVNGINMHVAEKGQGPVVLFLHGFPELWYSWRHQIIFLAARGYRAVAPDLRGYGETDAPTSLDSYTCFHIIGDVIALIDSLGVDQVFLVAHDWGAVLAWNLCLFRPDKIKAFVSLSVPYLPRDPSVKPIDRYRAILGDDFYMCRFQDHGKIEAEIATVGAAGTIKKVLTSIDPGPLMIPNETWFEDHVSIVLPHWLTEEDINYYASRFEQKGFTGPLNYYRSMNRNWELLAPWTGAQVKVPSKFIVGSQDLVYNMPGVKEYVHGRFKKYVPLLEEVVVMDGIGHFINQEIAEEISTHIYDFIKQF